MAADAQNVPPEEDWLNPYLKSSQAKENETGGIKNGRRVSQAQRSHNLRRRSWACPPSDAFENQRSPGILLQPLGKVTFKRTSGEIRRSQDGGASTSRPSSRPSSRPGSRKASLSRDSGNFHQYSKIMPNVMTMTVSTSLNPSSEAAMYSSDGVGLPLFRNWDAKNTANEDSGSWIERTGSLDLGDLEAVRARLVDATESWAAEDAAEPQSECVLSEALKVATSAAAARKLINFQKEEAAMRAAAGITTPIPTAEAYAAATVGTTPTSRALVQGVKVAKKKAGFWTKMLGGKKRPT